MDVLQSRLQEAESRAIQAEANLATTKKELDLATAATIDMLVPEPDWQASLSQVMPEHTLVFITSESCVPCKDARSLVLAPLVSAGWNVWIVDAESLAAKDLGVELFPMYIGYKDGVEIGRTASKPTAQATVNTITSWWGLGAVSSQQRPNTSAAAPQPPKSTP